MCDSPYYVSIKGKPEDTPVPCGRCPNCKKRKAAEWGFRLEQENRVSTSAYFITLTYNTKHVPIAKSGYLTLDKEDFRLFMKRLRYHEKGSPLKYYGCGEYGTQGFRPHYHLILFNLRDPESIHKSWTKGNVDIIDDVNPASIAYVCKYLHKEKRIPMHKNDDRIPEFSRMSKKLGHNYIAESFRYHHADPLNRIFLTRPDGVKIPMPRYYREKLFSKNERQQQNAHIAQTVETETQLAREAFNKANPLSHGEIPNTSNDYDLRENSKRIGRSKRFCKEFKNRDKI